MTKFVTEDSRPILACFVCCAQLKKCYRLLKKCLKAEELFARMMSEDYEQKPLINQDQFELFHGFIKTPTESINIVDVGLTESIVVKEELPAVCERLNDIIEPQEEHGSDDDQETVNYRFTVINNHLDIEYIDPRHSASDVDDHEPLMHVKTELEEELEVSGTGSSVAETNNVCQQHTQRNTHTKQKRPYSNAERQRRYRERKKADKMNTCTTHRQSIEVYPQQEQPQEEQKQNGVQIKQETQNGVQVKQAQTQNGVQTKQAQSSAERQRRYRKLLREQQKTEDINTTTVLSKTHATSLDRLQNVDQAALARKRRLNQQRQRRFRARRRFESPSASSHQAQAERYIL